MRALILLLLAAFVAAPAVAQVPTNAPEPAGPQTKPSPLDRVICRTEEGLGSRLNKQKVCMTLREWRDQQNLNQETLQKLQQQAEAVYNDPG